VNREELNWLLETIQDAKIAERFVLASVRARQNFLSGNGRCGPGTVLDHPHRESILSYGTRHSTEYATTELPIAIVR